MHRSGTSFVTQAVKELGVSLGRDEDLLPPGRDNPTGYWENRPIKELDDELLAELGGSWDRPPVLTPSWAEAEALEPFRERARAVLATSFGTPGADELVAWKDPRLSLLLDFWRTVTPIALTVVVVRDPVEVAASLAARNGFTPDTSALLWLRYVLASLADDHPRLVVRYDDVIERPAEVLRQLAAALGRPAPDAEVEAAVRASFRPELRHHRSGSPSLPSPDDPLSELARSVWNDGALDPDVAGGPVRAALAQGWLRAPLDDDALAQARAKVAKLEATLRKRELAKHRLDERRARLDEQRAALDRRRAELDDLERRLAATERPTP